MGKFTKILSRIIYIVFGGNELLVFLGCVSALLATWAAPAVSVSDFTREAAS